MDVCRGGPDAVTTRSGVGTSPEGCGCQDTETVDGDRIDQYRTVRGYGPDRDTR